MIQQVLIILIFIAAVAYLGYLAYKSFTEAECSSGCGKCAVAEFKKMKAGKN